MPNLHFHATDKKRTSDRFFYTYQKEDNEYKCYAVQSVMGDYITASVVSVGDYTLGNVHLHSVGILRMYDITEEEEDVLIADIAGKCVLCEKYLVCLPKITLVE